MNLKYYIIYISYKMSDWNKDKKIFDDAYDKIMYEREFVDIRPYSHNIISLTLKIVSDKLGQEEANELIIMCDLEELGWSIHEE